jgi:predicted NUDIX family NTP pyrophosphohydrolase
MEEETGVVPVGEFLRLEPLRQAGGKLVFAWALRADFDASQLKSNMFSMEWPPKSGKHKEFPEIDRAEWFGMEPARVKILKGQAAFLDQLLDRLGDVEG